MFRKSASSLSPLGWLKGGLNKLFSLSVGSAPAPAAAPSGTPAETAAKAKWAQAEALRKQPAQVDAAVSARRRCWCVTRARARASCRTRRSATPSGSHGSCPPRIPLASTSRWRKCRFCTTCAAILPERRKQPGKRLTTASRSSTRSRKTRTRCAAMCRNARPTQFKGHDAQNAIVARRRHGAGRRSRQR